MNTLEPINPLLIKRATSSEKEEDADLLKKSPSPRSDPNNFPIAKRSPRLDPLKIQDTISEYTKMNEKFITGRIKNIYIFILALMSKIIYIHF